LGGAGGWGRARSGGNSGGVAPPEIDFDRIEARLLRYFGQTPDYWLDHGTLQDWRKKYGRELIETPPVYEMVAAYLGYKGPGEARADVAEQGEWECPFPETTE